MGDEAASGSAVRSAVENTITTGGQCPIAIKLDFHSLYFVPLFVVLLAVVHCGNIFNFLFRTT